MAAQQTDARDDESAGAEHRGQGLTADCPPVELRARYAMGSVASTTDGSNKAPVRRITCVLKKLEVTT
jgi:hypothetical protein